MIDVYRLNAAIAMRPFLGISANPAVRSVLEIIDLMGKRPPAVPVIATARPRPAPIVVDVHVHLHGDAGDGATGK